MSISPDKELETSYSKVFNISKLASNFDENQLQRSRSLFDYNSRENLYVPRYLSVNALLGGIEFSDDFQALCMAVQRRIDDIIQTDERYWVSSKNLGVEYLVTKWPEEPHLSSEMEANLISFIDSLSIKSYPLKIRGFQINQDGCVVLRGYDNKNILELRSTLQGKFDWIPKRQSGWAHIPLGRILCKLHRSTYAKLISECERSFEELYFEERIREIHYVHEFQWYMVKKSKIRTFVLG